MEPWESDAAGRRGASGFGMAAFSCFSISSGDDTKDEATWRVGVTVLQREYFGLRAYHLYLSPDTKTKKREMLRFVLASRKSCVIPVRKCAILHSK